MTFLALSFSESKDDASAAARFSAAFGPSAIRS